MNRPLIGWISGGREEVSRQVADVAVVICTYSEARWNDLVRSIDSVMRQRRSAREVVVVVDHNPELFSRVRSELGGVDAVENRFAAGLSGARNTGVANTRSPVIAFLDDDAFAAEDWLELLEAGYRDATVNGVGGAVEPVWQSGRPAWFPPEFGWVVGCGYRGLPASATSVRNLLGCNMSFRREVFESVGGFRTGIGRIEAHPVGCEETELCIRALHAGPERIFLYQPAAKVFHQVPRERATLRYYRSRCFAEGLSKAVVTRLVGSADGLAAERKHALRTLPAGVGRDLAATVRHRDVSYLERAGASVAGLAFTTGGFAAGRFRGLWTEANRAVALNAGSLVATTAVTAGLGFLYWLVAARGFSPGAVGLAAASVSAMTLLAYVGMLGLGTMLMGELPHQKGRESRLVTASVLVSGAAGGVLGLLFAALAPLLAPDFQPLQQSPEVIALFAAGVALTSASLVTDQALIGLLLGGLQFGRNAVFAVVKLGALVLAALWVTERTGITIYATWAIGNLVSMVALAALAGTRGWLRFPVRRQWAVLHGLRGAAIGHHLLNLALQFPVLGLPIVVTAALTATFNAYFYVAWMVAFSFVWVAPAALSFVLYTVTSRAPAALARTIRFTLGLSFIAGAISNLVLPVIGDPILRLFGGAYAAHAGPALQVLVLTVFPLIVKDHFVSLCRLDGRLARATALIGAAGVLELAGAATGARLGALLGLCLGWGAVICVEALCMAPAVYHAAMRDGRAGPPSTVDRVQLAGRPTAEAGLRGKQHG